MPRLPGPGRGLGPRLHQLLFDVKDMLSKNVRQHDDINLAFSCFEQAVLIHYPRRDEYVVQRTRLKRVLKKIQSACLGSAENSDAREAFA